MFRWMRKMLGSQALSRRWWQAGVVCLLAVVMLGADGAGTDNARFGRIGHTMMCVCSCGQILLECNHVGCPDSSRMIGELQQQLGGPNGSSDRLVMNWFVAKYGATVLAAPIRGGFDNVAWIIPIALFLLATLGTAFLVRAWSQRQRAVPAAAHVIPTGLQSDLRDRIRRETEL